MTRSDTLAETVFITRCPPPKKPVGRRMVGLVVAVAATLGFLTASAVPVRADSDDLAKALAAIAVIGLLATAADGGNSNAHQPPPKPRPMPAVPASCGMRLPGDANIVYSERCILQSGFQYRLPTYCARPARIYGRPDHVYGPNCLARAGIKISNRR